jgi:hypothetical protein
VGTGQGARGHALTEVAQSLVANPAIAVGRWTRGLAAPEQSPMARYQGRVVAVGGGGDKAEWVSEGAPRRSKFRLRRAEVTPLAALPTP